MDIEKNQKRYGGGVGRNRPLLINKPLALGLL